MTAHYEFHALANLFPLIEGQEFGALVDDIRANGLRDNIWLFGGQIMDGRNRYRACAVAGVEIPSWQFSHFDPAQHGDPLAFVLSKNLSRRHLNESQRAMVAASIATMRQGEKRGDAKPANLPVSPKMDQAAAASSLNVSERSVRSAKKVQEKGTPELRAAVEQGVLAVSAADKAADLTPAEQGEIVRLAKEGKANPVRTAIKKAARAAKEERLGAEQRALPDKRYGVIYADPEWRFEPFSRETGMDRAPENHYPTSPTEEIMRRDVASIAAEDCVLFLWVTGPMIQDGFAVMKAWGFDYKAQLVWNKTRPGEQRGPGYWFTGEHEVVLLGTRGNVPAPAPGNQWRSSFDAPVGEHSEKPEHVHALIEAYFPHLPKIELNARRARDGWDTWGYEAPADDAARDLLSEEAMSPSTKAMLDTAARIAALTDESGMVHVSESHTVAAGFLVDGELEEAEAFALRKRRTEAQEAVKHVAQDRGPRWLSTLVGPTELSAAAPAAPKPEPSIPEIPAFLLRPQPAKEGGE